MKKSLNLEVVPVSLFLILMTTLPYIFKLEDFISFNLFVYYILFLFQFLIISEAIIIGREIKTIQLKNIDFKLFRCITILLMFITMSGLSVTFNQTNIIFFIVSVLSLLVVVIFTLIFVILLLTIKYLKELLGERKSEI